MVSAIFAFRENGKSFSEASASRHLKYLLGNSQKGQLLILLDLFCSYLTQSVCPGGSGEHFVLHSFVPRVPASVVLYKVLGRDAVTALRKPTKKFHNSGILEFLINEETLKAVPLEEGMATHSSILAWRIPGTEKLGGL